MQTDLVCRCTDLVRTTNNFFMTKERALDKAILVLRDRAARLDTEVEAGKETFDKMQKEGKDAHDLFKQTERVQNVIDEYNSTQEAANELEKIKSAISALCS